MVKNNLQILCQKIISGGQTGVDRGILDACLDKKFPCGGWCPKGRRAEDGVILTKYPLTETKEKEYSVRTRRNVEDADGTIIMFESAHSAGTELTADIACRLKKPLRKITAETPVKNILIWMYLNKIKILNIAGPRESEVPGSATAAYQIISDLIDAISNNNSINS
ncbi:putative molybdenum carrier protein [Maribellus mangrovi]|uniref:putative molybdenum carrier protein n=1 Tax=Maribellus mangrovi TaxID=3133146 RepID=UPI0030EDF572